MKRKLEIEKKKIRKKMRIHYPSYVLYKSTNELK